MQSILDGLGLLVKALGALLGFLVSAGVVLMVLLLWSDSNKEEASYSCHMRRMETKIASENTSVYHNFCMGASGYRRVGKCEDNFLLAAGTYCYAPDWQFWR